MLDRRRAHRARSWNRKKRAALIAQTPYQSARWLPAIPGSASVWSPPARGPGRGNAERSGAIRPCRSAITAPNKLRNPFLVTWSHLDLGFNRARFSRFDEAIPWLDLAQEGAQQCGAKTLLAAASGNLGWCYLMLGDMDRAEVAPAPL